MKKKLLLFAILLSASITGTAQNFAWGAKYGGTGSDVVTATFVDNAGNVYSTGYFIETCDFDPTAGNYSLTSETNYEIYVTKVSSEGNLVWAKSFGGPADDYGTAISVDGDGNVFVTGEFQDIADFDPSTNEALINSNGYLDVFVMKLDSNGNLAWAKGFGGTDFEQTSGIQTDENGDIYLAGFFYAEADFNPGTEQFNMTPVGSGDIFAMKLDATGNFLWAKQIGGTGLDLATAMKLAANGDLYVTGNFSYTVDFNPDPAVMTNLTAALEDADYLLRLTPNGEYVNAVKVNDATFHTYSLGIDIDSQNNVLLTGYFGGIGTFPMPDQSMITLSTPDYFNSYVVKISDSGETQWAKPVFADQGTAAYRVAANSHDEVFVYGFYTNVLTMDALSVTQAVTGNAQENFLAKLDLDGNTVGLYGFGGSNFVDSCSFGMDGNDNLYISSSFENTVDINPFQNQDLNVTADGFRDVYILKLGSGELSTPDFETGIDISIYPNPTSEVLNVHAQYDLVDFPWILVDQTGRIVGHGKLDESYQISLNGLQSGMYVLKVGDVGYKIVKN